MHIYSEVVAIGFRATYYRITMPRLCLVSPVSLLLCEFVCMDTCVYMKQSFINERMMNAYVNTDGGTINFTNVLPYFTCSYF